MGLYVGAELETGNPNESSDTKINNTNSFRYRRNTVSKQTTDYCGSQISFSLVPNGTHGEEYLRAYGGCLGFWKAMKDAAWRRYASGRCQATFDPEMSE